MYFTSFDGTKLYYEIVGEGHPIILLHGNRQSSEDMVSLKNRCREFAKTICLDSRGHGKSEHGENPLTLSVLVQDIIALSNTLKLNCFDIIGYSDGANIAISLALEHPELLSHLVLISPNLSTRGLKPIVRFSLKTALAFLKHFPSFYKRYELLSLNLQEVSYSEASFKRLKIPVLLLSGTYDIVHKHHLLKVADKLPDAEFIIVKSATHHSILKKSENYIASFFQIKN